MESVMLGDGMKSLFLLGLLTLAGCSAALPPKELLSARDAFQKAKEAQAADLAPVQLEEARQALAKADGRLESKGDDQTLHYLAYVAERRAEVAHSAAATEGAKRAKAKSEDDLKGLQSGIQEATESKLAKTKQQLEKERLAAEREKERAEREKSELKQGVAKTQAELEAERKARQAAEQRLSAALASLEKIAQVKEESRGIVITLTGAVLFVTGKWELLPTAQDKLSDVAKALKDQGYKHIVVEGHTDSVGSAKDNLELSRKRAEAVREHLVKQGIDGSKIEAKGIGKERPVADNGTPEGRANNRRVELIVTPVK
jgi:outer membrane protein OmpA-like peptidoglycan-associated protein